MSSDNADEVNAEVDKDFPSIGIGTRYQVRRHKTNTAVWFVYDCALERVADVHYGPNAQETTRMRCASLNKTKPKP